MAGSLGPTGHSTLLPSFCSALPLLVHPTPPTNGLSKGIRRTLLGKNSPLRSSVLALGTDSASCGVPTQQRVSPRQVGKIENSWDGARFTSLEKIIFKSIESAAKSPP